METKALLQKGLAWLLLLCMVVGFLPATTFAAETADYSATIDALAKPYNVRDYLPTLGSDGCSILGGGSYYFVVPYDSGTKGHVLDMSVFFGQQDYFSSREVTISGDSLVDADTDLVLDCVHAYKSTGELEKYRFRIHPSGGLAFKHPSFSSDGSYLIPALGNAENYATTAHDGMMAVHSYKKYTGDTAWINYTLSYIPVLDGFRFVRNADNPETAYNRLMVFKVASQVVKLYRAITDVRELACGNTNGQYDAAAYTAFIACLKESIALYEENNTLMDAQQQEIMRAELDAQASELLARRAEVIKDDDNGSVSTAYDSNSILRELHSDTQSQPASYGAQDALAKLKNGLPLSFTHRGAWEKVPQNSLLSVYESIMLGVDGAEIDVRLSADSVPVLCHDAHIRGCTTVNQNASDAESLVSNLYWADLRTKELVAPFASTSQDIAYAINQEQANILNTLSAYESHYGSAAATGSKLTMARLDDVLELVQKYGPNTILTLDKMDSLEVFTACCKLVCEKEMFGNVIFKISQNADSFASWLEAAASACGVSSDTLKSRIQCMYVIGADADTSAIAAHLSKGSYLMSVEITYGADKAAAAEEGIRSVLKPYCASNGIALYASTIGDTYCGGRSDAEPTWAHLLSMGFDGIMSDSAVEIAAYMNTRLSGWKASDTIQAEHMSGCNGDTMHFTVQQSRDANGNKLVRNICNADYLEYSNISFTGSEKTLYFRARGLCHGASVRFYLDEISADSCLASYTLAVDPEPYSLSAPLQMAVPAGNHSVIAVASGIEDAALLHFDSFSFAPEDHYLFFGFTDTQADRERYSAAAYGSLETYDEASTWTGANITSKTIADGTLNFGISNAQPYGYVQTAEALDFTPGINDICTIRLRIQNAEQVDTSRNSFLYFYFSPDGKNYQNAYRIDYALDPQTLDGAGYFDITFPLDHDGYLSAEYIGGLCLYFQNFCSKKRADIHVSIDHHTVCNRCKRKDL